MTRSEILLAGPLYFVLLGSLFFIVRTETFPTPLALLMIACAAVIFAIFIKIFCRALKETTKDD